MFLRQFITVHSGLYQHYCFAISSLHLLDSHGCKNSVLESKIVDCHVSARVVKGLKSLATYVDASPKAFSARLNLDFTVSCDVTWERLAVLSPITERERTPRDLGCIFVSFLAKTWPIDNRESACILTVWILYWPRCSDEVAIGKKMIYASSKDALKKRFTGLNTEFQCTDSAEFQHSELVKDLIHKDRV